MLKYILLLIGIGTNCLYAITYCGDEYSCPESKGTCLQHYYDNDGDGLGRIGFDWLCDLDAGAYVSNGTDWNDSCYCSDNTDDGCLDCELNCKYLTGGANNTQYLAYNNSNLNYDCPAGTEREGQKGCDICGTCNGLGKTWYPDVDGDGYGDPLGELGCPNSSLCSNGVDTTKVDCEYYPPDINIDDIIDPKVWINYVTDDNDLDDACHCGENTDAALDPGGICMDNASVCQGDQYTANCSDIDFIRQKYSTDGKCPAIGCDGALGSDHSINYYSLDNDTDGWGGGLDSKWLCSIDADGYSPNRSDSNDNDFCLSNFYDYCGKCDGENLNLSSCSNNIDSIKVDCEISNAIWTQKFSGDDVDCNGDCYDITVPDSLRAQVDTCSEDCCGGQTRKQCSYYNNLNDFGGKYDSVGDCCDGIVDQCGVCNGDNRLNYQGRCYFNIYPGDTDMDGSVTLNDLNPIVNYWGAKLSHRSVDVDGGLIASKTKWEGQPQTLLENRCLYSADANGDGVINLFDVTTVFMNQGKTHQEAVSLDCSLPVRVLDMDIYHSIFMDLPNGDLKQSMAEMYGFEILPNYFEVEQNYPNPFNPITTINYAIPQRGDVGIKIYNLKGQSLVDIDKIGLYPGYYSFVWDASEFSSGIYYCMIYYNNNLVKSQKMILIK